MNKPENYEERREEGYKRYSESVDVEDDPIMLVLRAHLFSESILEEIIRLYLARGDRVLEQGNLSYNQKLTLVHSFDKLGDNIFSTLKNLNKIRNECAHQLDKNISEADIRRIGSPLGKNYTRIRKRFNYQETEILKGILAYVTGSLQASAQIEEDKIEIKNV